MSETMEIPRPILPGSYDTAPYFKAAAEGRLSVPRCTVCGTYIWEPQQYCNNSECLSRDVEWVTLSGEGTVYTFVVVGRPVHPWFADKVPYVLALVEPDDAPGIRIMADVTGDPQNVKFGSRVKAGFEKVSDDFGLVHFDIIS